MEVHCGTLHSLVTRKVRVTVILSGRAQPPPSRGARLSGPQSGRTSLRLKLLPTEPPRRWPLTRCFPLTTKLPTSCSKQTSETTAVAALSCVSVPAISAQTWPVWPARHPHKALSPSTRRRYWLEIASRANLSAGLVKRRTPFLREGAWHWKRVSFGFIKSIRRTLAGLLC